MTQYQIEGLSNPLRVLVTGAGGYLGSWIMHKGREHGFQMIASGRGGGADVEKVDLLNGDDTRALIARVKPDWVIHAAANVPKALEGYTDTNAANDSLRMVQHLLTAKPRRVLFISSMTVYGDDVSFACEEELGTTPATPYGRAKLEAENEVRRSGVTGFCTRIPGLFGAPREGGLLCNVIKAANKGEQPSLPLEAIHWSAMHVADAARAISELLLYELTSMRSVNIGYQGPVSVNRMIQTVNEHCSQTITDPIRHPDFQYNLERVSALTNISLPYFDAALIQFLKDQTLLETGMLS